MTQPKSNLQPRSNLTLWTLLGVALTFGLGYFYTAPQVQILRDIRVGTAALALDKQAYELQLSQVSALDTRLSAEQTALDQLSLAVPAKFAVDELMVSLQAMASTSGIVLATIQPASEGTADGVAVTLSARGSYAGIHLFLEELSKNQRPIKVTELSLNAASDVAGASLVNASLQLVAARAGSGSVATNVGESAGAQTSTAASSTTPGSLGPDAGGPQ